jgi:hypothetical protein
VTAWCMENLTVTEKADALLRQGLP